MNVGRFNQLLDIMAPLPEKEIVDEYGRRQVPWRRVTTVLANAQDVTGKDFYDAAAHGLEDTVTFTLRWLRGLDASMRIIWHGEIYEIVQVNHLGYRQDFMRVKARRARPEGGVINHYGAI